MTHLRGPRRRKFLIGKLAFGIAIFSLFAAGMRCTAALGEDASAGERQPALTDLTAKLHVGTEFFLNRTETKETVEKHFKLMHDNGITLVRIFVIWDDIERTEGNWNMEGYDWIYDAAAKNGIKIGATLCLEDPPGWMKKTTFYHQRANLDNADLRAHGEIYLQKVVGRYKNHPGAGAWFLMNEPTKYHEDADTFKVFGRWLEKKYGTVAELNKHWFRPFNSFEEVKLDPDQFANYWMDEEMYLDWKAFNVDNLIDTLTWIREKVLAIDPKHPVHFNVTSPTGDASGQDVWRVHAHGMGRSTLHPRECFRRTVCLPPRPDRQRKQGRAPQTAVGHRTAKRPDRLHRRLPAECNAAGPFPMDVGFLRSRRQFCDFLALAAQRHRH
jgi:hypothetical protein